MNKALILIVEDDPNVASFIDATLCGEYDTLVASDGKEALRQVDRASPDLLILDIRLPQMSGLDLYLHMKERKALRDMPVIVITGYPDELETARLRSMEIDVVLKKPVTPRRIRSAVKQLLLSRDQ